MQKISRNVQKNFNKYVKQKMTVRDDITKMGINESCNTFDELKIAGAPNTYFEQNLLQDQLGKNKRAPHATGDESLPPEHIKKI